MLRCRDVCVRCARTGWKTPGLLKGQTSSARGIASRASREGGYVGRLQADSRNSTITLATNGALQSSAFSTTATRRITEEEIEDLRTGISIQEERGVGRKGLDKAENENKPALRPKPAISSRALEEEMRWLKDPAQLADRVKALLKKGQVEKGVTLVREAQKNGSACIVAWNHVMDHEMGAGRPDSAFKYYNDVSCLFLCCFLDFERRVSSGLVTNVLLLPDEEKRSKTGRPYLHDHV
jgi:hypothetical protein